MEPNTPLLQPESPPLEPQVQLQPEIGTPQNISSVPSPATPQQNSIPIINRGGMFNGRLNRIGYLMAIVYIFAFLLIPIILLLLLRGHAIGNMIALLFGIVGTVLIIPVGLSVGIRRWHDMDKSGFFVLFGLIPFAGIVLLIFYFFVPGSREINKYGEPDNKPSSVGKVLFGR
jgi:uncharacterized membrane protein YhaH (DUF805 family)